MKKKDDCKCVCEPAKKRKRRAPVYSRPPPPQFYLPGLPPAFPVPTIADTVRLAVRDEFDRRHHLPKPERKPFYATTAAQTTEMPVFDDELRQMGAMMDTAADFLTSQQTTSEIEIPRSTTETQTAFETITSETQTEPMGVTSVGGMEARQRREERFSELVRLREAGMLSEEALTGELSPGGFEETPSIEPQQDAPRQPIIPPSTLLSMYDDRPDSITVNQLRDTLSSIGLPVSGVKADLARRLRESGK